MFLADSVVRLQTDARNAFRESFSVFVSVFESSSVQHCAFRVYVFNFFFFHDLLRVLLMYWKKKKKPDITFPNRVRFLRVFNSKKKGGGKKKIHRRPQWFPTGGGPRCLKNLYFVIIVFFFFFYSTILI